MDCWPRISRIPLIGFSVKCEPFRSTRAGSGINVHRRCEPSHKGRQTSPMKTMLSAFLLVPALALAQPTARVPFVKSAVTIDGTLSPAEWDGVLEIAVDGTTPTENPGWNPLNGNAIAPADLSYTLRLMHDGEFLYVSFDVTDDSVSDDFTAKRRGHTEVWEDDCTEVFIDGDRDRDATESSWDAPRGDRDWREGMQPHFGVANGCYWENGARQFKRTWWAATARTAKGYSTEFKFAFAGIDTADGEAKFVPLKVGDTVGFSVLVNDDDNGGQREDQLAWIGGGTDDSLYRSQGNWGLAKMLPAPPTVTPNPTSAAVKPSLSGT